MIRESNVHFLHIANVDRPVQFYSLDVIISVGYRVKSKRGIEFRQWASKILKQYMIDGYAINEKRLNALQKTVDIQTRMLADALNVEEKDILRAVNLYTGTDAVRLV
ncbi:Virulence protein RhuM family protein [Kandleria vitulina]|uniref:Virulence protein RhuM family protein n=1 Tax=Kandleria vitulina TaxID=1630 RepID=A0A1H2WD51_9FIRM|nr:RhuM family protein [Kandleria vitulina]SDW78520.1 Virulence protein RhuM family protein [Kandleria vitulina]